jgi:hypothetical protein
MDKYQNPPERWFVILALVVLILFSFGAIYLFMIGTTLGAFLFLLLGLLVSFFAIRRPLLQRPKSIGFADEGIILFLPRSKQRTVKWNRITGIHVIEGNPKTFIGRLERASVILEKGSRAPIDLSFELGMLVKDEYWKRFGERVYRIWTYQTKRNLK